MNNKEKQELAGLEARVLKLENFIEAINYGMQSAAAFSYNCNMCGAHDPQNTGFTCSMPDCCQGLNPEDEPPKDES